MSLDDMYHVEKIMATGAGGVTELVTVEGAGPFVRKKMPASLARSSVWAVLSDCECPRLPKIEAMYALPDEFVVVYDFVPGQTLERRVDAEGALCSQDAIAITRDICEAVGALHTHGVIHRDLSPSNVVLASDGAHLIDLGIARKRVEGASRDTMSLGTWGFAAPEQYGFAQTDARSDVYSTGRLLGYMLTGVRPDADEYEVALEAVSSPLRDVVNRACAFEPSSRYQEVSALSEALGGACSLEPAADSNEAEGRSASVQHNESKRPHRAHRPVALILFAVIIIGLGIWLAFLSHAGSNADKQSQQAADGSAQSIAQTSDSQSGASVISEPVSDSTSSLEVAESGWSVGSSGFVYYAAGIRNASETDAVTFPVLRITGYDASGNVLFSQDQVLAVCAPGEVTYFGGQVGNGQQVPDRVEFSALASSTSALRSVETKPSIAVSTVNSVASSYGMVDFTGNVTVDDGDALRALDPLASSLAVTVVLRDASGAIVWGQTDYVDGWSSGASVPFDIKAIDIPAYATVEAYAQPW